MSVEPVERKQLKPLFKDKAAEAKLREEAFRKLSRQELFDQGFIKVSDLDDEELRYGRCRDTNTGLIPGVNKKTQLIPRELYDEMVAEHEARFKQKLRQNLDVMLDGMIELATDDTVEPKDRLDAMKYLIDRTAGKAAEHVSVQVTHAPWEDLLNSVSGIAPITREEHRQLGRGIIDAEYEDIPDEQAATAPSSSPIPPQGEEIVQEGPIPEPVRRQEPDAVPYGTADTPRSPAQPTEDQYTGQTGARPPSTRYKQPLITTDSQPEHQLSYAEQARKQLELAERRDAAKKKIQGAKRNRKIARAMGADAIKTEITGATVGEDGQVSFDAKD